MSHSLLDAKTTLLVTAASKQQELVGAVNVALQLTVVKQEVPELLISRAFAQDAAPELINLELTLPQAFQLLSALEECRMSLRTGS